MQPECKFTDVGNTGGGYSGVAVVGEGFRVAARIFHAPVEMIPANDTESGRLHRFCVRLDRRQQLGDVLRVGPPRSKVSSQRHVRRIGFGQDGLLFGRCRHAVKLGDELAHRDLAAMRDVGGHVAAEATEVVPMRRCRP
jgi:hypothetical protein